MAFIPDDAEERFHELSPSAERFYIFLCKTRNHKMQVSFGSLDVCAERYGWKRATKYAIQKELISKGWIEPDGNAWLLLVGDFSPVNKSKKSDNQSKNLDSESKNLDDLSKKTDETSKNLDSHIRNIPALPALPEREWADARPAADADAEETTAAELEHAPPSQRSEFRKTSLPAADALANEPRFVSQAEAIFCEIFPDAVPTDGEIFGEIENLNAEVWRRVCNLWRRNDWNLSNLGNLIDRYENEIKKANSNEPVMENGFIVHSAKAVSKWYH